MLVQESYRILKIGHFLKKIQIYLGGKLTQNCWGNEKMVWGNDSYCWGNEPYCWGSEANCWGNEAKLLGK